MVLAQTVFEQLCCCYLLIISIFKLKIINYDNFIEKEWNWFGRLNRFSMLLFALLMQSCAKQ